MYDGDFADVESDGDEGARIGEGGKERVMIERVRDQVGRWDEERKY